MGNEKAIAKELMLKYYEFFAKKMLPFVFVYGVVIMFAVHYIAGPFVPALRFSLVKSPMIFAFGILYYFIKMEIPEIILFCKSRR